METEFDIIFIDGIEDRIETQYSSFITYLFTLGSVLNQFHYTFKIFNLSLLSDYSLDGMIDELKKIRFKTIGMTTNADNILNVINIVNALKPEFIDCPIILGGAQVSFADIETMGKCKCDVIIRNEGEYILIQLLDFYIRKRGRLEDIFNTTYRKDDKIIKNDCANKYVDLLKLPLPLYQILMDKKYWYFPDNFAKTEIDSFLEFIYMKNNFIILSRGCPYNCIFCVEGNIGRKYRQLDISRSMQYIEHFLKITGAKHINIADSTLTTSPERIRDFCKAIKKIKEKYDFKWYAEGRANVLAKNPELIGVMHNAGLFCLQIGIESGSDKVLQIQQKKITTEQIRVVAKEVGKYDGLMLTGHIILGNPGETKSTFRETINFVKELFILSHFNFDIKFGYLVPYVGTPIREHPQDFNIEIVIDQFEYKKIKGYNEVLVKPQGLSIAEVENLYFEIRNELKSFFLKNIFDLSKTKFDKLMNFYKSLEKNGLHLIDNQWINSLWDLVFIQKYYSIFNQKTTITDLLFIKKNPDKVFPLHLQSFKYNSIEKHEFIDVKGRIINMNYKDICLWELADGSCTINDIISIFNSGSEEEYQINEEYALNFYIKMYKCFNLVFKEL